MAVTKRTADAKRAGPGSGGRPWTLVYDGTCNVCSRLARRVQHWDSRHVIQAIASQNDTVSTRFPWISHEAFDISESAQRVLARHWQARTPAEREEFTQLFADLLERTYIARMDEYGGERIRYTGETVDGNFAAVRARIVTKSGTEVAVESRMNLRGDRWLIYDILIENVSLVANYRSQFDRIIRSSSYEELVKRLKTKRDEFLNESAPRARRSSG